MENIQHIKPVFALMRTDSVAQAFRFVNLTKAIDSLLSVIVLSTNSDVERFIGNNWLVNVFFLRYPADDKAFQATIARLAETKPVSDRPVLIAGSVERQKLIQGLPLLGLSQEPILVQGEPGVGKQLMARAIFSCSPARQAVVDFIDAKDISGPWIRETCARMDSLNHDNGSHRASVIKNIERLPLNLQSQLLLLMENVNGNGMGGKKNCIAAPFITLAGSDLASRVQKGAFRKDLYHRLSVFKVTIPPLRGHSEDIFAMTEYFAAQTGIRHHGGLFRLSDEVMRVFVDYLWPGNVPELKRAIQQLMLSDSADWMHAMTSLCGRGLKNRVDPKANGFIDADHLHTFLENNRDVSLKKAKRRYAIQVEKKIMKAALVQTHGNCKKAAVLLSISYKSMLNKVKAYQLV